MHSMTAELDRQVRNLHELGYPKLAGMSKGQLDSLVRPLRDLVPDVLSAEGPDAGTDAGTDAGAGSGRIPFVVVVTSALVPTVDAVHRWSVGDRAGFTDMEAELPEYRPIEGLEVPADPVYLLLDVDTGADTLGIRPDDALPRIREAGRTPLTIDEGVALVTHFPEVFGERNAFQALGSRAPNKRIPSFWISKGAPRLGWCWAGNPHTWLGAASAGRRRGQRVAARER